MGGFRRLHIPRAGTLPEPRQGRQLVAGLCMAVLVGCGSGNAGTATPRRDVPRAQQAALADGEVSYTELRESMERTVECLTNEGVTWNGRPLAEVDEYVQDGVRFVGLKLNEVAGGPSIDEIDVIETRCTKEYSFYVQVGYSSEHPVGSTTSTKSS